MKTRELLSKLKHLEVDFGKLSDVDDILLLQEEWFSDDTLKYGRDELTQLINLQNQRLFIARYRGNFAGYCIVTKRPMRPWTGGDFLAVKSGYGGKGVAAKILDTVLSRNSRPFFRIFVRPSNKKAIKLYKRFGFIVTGRRKNNYPDGEDALIMMTIFR